MSIVIPLEQTLEPPQTQTHNPNPTHSADDTSSSSAAAEAAQKQQQQQKIEWETKARAWLSSLPEGKSLTLNDVELWINNNGSSNNSLPEHVSSMPLQDLHQYLTSIHTTMTQPLSPDHDEEKDGSPVDTHPARFKRTELWMPVYSWLESLDTDEVIRSQDVIDWLTNNPEVRDQLCTRHSRYHLMHYIKKCHMKILSRKEKKKGLQPNYTPKSIQIQKTEVAARPVPIPFQFAGNASSNFSKENDVYVAKRSEALHKFGILLELEKQLSVHFQKP